MNFWVKMFKPSKEIVSKEGIVHFRRWTAMTTPWFSVYVHQILEPDSDEHLHNHPWSLRSLVLRGQYVEKMQIQEGMAYTLRKPGHYAFRSLSDYHKIDEVVDGPVWTLNLVGKRENDDWGYLTSVGPMPNLSYRSLKRTGHLPKGDK